jgi:hypothetical protein
VPAIEIEKAWRDAPYQRIETVPIVFTDPTSRRSQQGAVALVTQAQRVEELLSAAACGVVLEADELAVTAVIGTAAASTERHQQASVMTTNRNEKVFVRAMGQIARLVAKSFAKSTVKFLRYRKRGRRPS